MPVPVDFQEEVKLAQSSGERGDLRLRAEEAQGFEWESEGLRFVGEAQFKLKAFRGARDTFENLRKAIPNDVRANLRLGTIYQKLAQQSRRTRKRCSPAPTRRSGAHWGCLHTRGPRRGSLAARQQCQDAWQDDWRDRVRLWDRCAALCASHRGARVLHEGLCQDLTGYFPVPMRSL
jgi:hypothetical protein